MAYLISKRLDFKMKFCIAIKVDSVIHSILGFHYVVISFVPSMSFISLFLSYPSLSSSPLSLFSLSLGDDTK